MLLALDLAPRLEISMTLPTDAGARNTYALAVLRIAIGIFFLIFGQYKVFGTEFTLHGGFQFWINKFLEGGVYPFMAPVLRGFVLPHATAFAFLTAYGELAIGLGLVIGFLGLAGERRWTALDAGIALFVGLSGSARRLLAIFRREPQPFGVRALFRCVSGGPRRRCLVGQVRAKKVCIESVRRESMTGRLPNRVPHARTFGDNQGVPLD